MWQLLNKIDSCKEERKSVKKREEEENQCQEGNFKIGEGREESRGVMEEEETDWADEEIDNSRAFAADF